MSELVAKRLQVPCRLLKAGDYLIEPSAKSGGQKGACDW